MNFLTNRIKPFLFNLKQLLIAIDQLARVLLGIIVCIFKSNHYAYADETLSAYAWRKHNDYWYANALRIFIDILFLIITLGINKHHCQKSFESEVNKQHLPPDYK